MSVKSKKSISQVFAQEVLRGFFEAPEGFANMHGCVRGNSAARLTALLSNPNVRKCGHWSQWLALALALSV